MRAPSLRTLLALTTFAMAPIACTLIAEVDRSQIPDEEPSAGSGGGGGIGGDSGSGGSDTGSGGDTPLGGNDGLGGDQGGSGS